MLVIFAVMVPMTWQPQPMRGLARLSRLTVGRRALFTLAKGRSILVYR